MPEMMAHAFAFLVAYILACGFVYAGKLLAWLVGIDPDREELVIALVLAVLLYWYMLYVTRIRLENRTMRAVIEGLAKIQKAREADAAKAGGAASQASAPAPAQASAPAPAPPPARSEDPPALPAER